MPQGQKSPFLPHWLPSASARTSTSFVYSIDLSTSVVCVKLYCIFISHCVSFLPVNGDGTEWGIMKGDDTVLKSLDNVSTRSQKIAL